MDAKICPGVRMTEIPGETVPCWKEVVVKGMCRACYQRVRKGGAIDSIASPWDREIARRKKATNAD